MFTFLTPTNIYKRYRDAKDYTDKLTEPFPEFARIARNKPKANLGVFPPITDGTTSGIISKTPKNAVQQLPTGLVETEDDNDWLPIVAQFIYDNKILPCQNEDYGLFEKSHLVIEGGLTFGAQATFRRFAKHSDGFGPDFELIYWGDLAIQKGKKSGPACDYIFYRTWWQKADIEALIDSEEQLAAAAKKRGEKYEATWDTTALKEVMDHAGQKDQQATTPTEDERGTEATGIELITDFQKGVGAKFYTFNPSSKKIVRTKVNKDPRGCMPIDWFYGEIDGTNPLGRGLPEVIGALQNLIDARMQIAQYVLMYNTNPAVVQYGQMDRDFAYQANLRITSQDPNAKVTPVEIKTDALDNYTETQSYLQSQLYQRVSAPHSNLQSGNSVVSDGKTPTALNMQQDTVDVDINTVRKHFETWFESKSEGDINMWFAERSGTELLQLDDKTAGKLRKLKPTKNFDPSKALNDNNELLINYDTATPALKFRVDASSSKMQDDASQLQALQLVQKFVGNTPQLTQLLPQDKWISVYNAVVTLAGIEDPEKLQISDEEQKKMAEQAQMATQQAPAVAPKPPAGSFGLKDLVAAGAYETAAAMVEQDGLPGDELRKLGRQATVQDAQPIQPTQPQPNNSDPELTAIQDQIASWRQQGIPEQNIAQAIHAYAQQRQSQPTGSVNG